MRAEVDIDALVDRADEGGRVAGWPIHTGYTEDNDTVERRGRRAEVGRSHDLVPLLAGTEQGPEQ